MVFDRSVLHSPLYSVDLGMFFKNSQAYLRVLVDLVEIPPTGEYMRFIYLYQGFYKIAPFLLNFKN